MLVAVIVVGSKQGLILVETVLVLLGKLLTVQDGLGLLGWRCLLLLRMLLLIKLAVRGRSLRIACHQVLILLLTYVIRLVRNGRFGLACRTVETRLESNRLGLISDVLR